MTLAGCLYREESIPGRSPNVAEKAGINNRDFILADATMASSGSTSSPGQPGASTSGQTGANRPGQAGATSPGQAGTSSSGATAGLTSGRMYKVMKLDESRLSTLVGKRVEVTGSIKPDNDAKPGDRASNQNLPNIEATSIREVAGATCPSTPASESSTPSTTSPSRPSAPTTPTTPSPRPNPDPTSPRTPDTTNPTNPGNPGNPENPRPDTNR